MISEAPPLPDVYSTGGQLLFTGSTITDGQGVWQSIGGQEIGTVWGHGAYVAPDWSADWLHRESLILLDRWAQQDGAANFAALDIDRQAILKARLIREMRTNTYDAKTNSVTLSADRAAAFEQLAAYYTGVFGERPHRVRHSTGAHSPMQQSRSSSPPSSGGPPGPQARIAPARLSPTPTTGRMSRWSPTTSPPAISPLERLQRRRPARRHRRPGVVVLLAGEVEVQRPLSGERSLPRLADPRPRSAPPSSTSSWSSRSGACRSSWAALTAHYGVEGQGFYGFPLDRYLPYAVTRTWHLQLAIFWIATSWLATGLYVGPAVSGQEPKFQRLGVNVLFVALVLVVVGSLAGEWFGIQQKLGNLWFWFGNQGYEYVDLGRFWQILLFVGLVLWLVLMVRALRPALMRKSEDRSLLSLFLISSIAIPLFYAAGLMYGQRSHLAIAEYWRWWVVHLWVEGFFEVFATVVIAFLFTRLKLLEIRTATRAVLFSTTIFLSGGIIGTFHHLYFAGTAPR